MRARWFAACAAAVVPAAMGCDAVYGIRQLSGSAIDGGLDAPTIPDGPGLGHPDAGYPPCKYDPTTCGPAGNDSCCRSLKVEGGTFYRGYDGVTYTDMNNPATLSDFYLDKYEVTVGRFRAFVAAVSSGWTPAPGSGKHSYLNAGNGLFATQNDAGVLYETGWDPSWTSSLPTTTAAWNVDLGCSLTWTAAAAGNESLPIVCLTWFEAYAFCIWDGGFLPSEAEWDYAGAGGSEQRAYPWSSPPTSTPIACSYANYQGCPAGAPNRVGSESPMGDGKWGHSDLGGNVIEWNLDRSAGFLANPCDDCTDAVVGTNRSVRGGAYGSAPVYLLVSNARAADPTVHITNAGMRCARAP